MNVVEGLFVLASMFITLIFAAFCSVELEKEKHKQKIKKNKGK